MSATVDPHATIIQPDGLPLVILLFSCIFLGLSIIAVGLRTYIRLANNLFGLDDLFILAGTVVYTAVVGLTIYGLLVGIGRLEEYLNPWQWSEALKYYIIWILMYVVALALVKSSVCITIQRIASMEVSLNITIYILLSITWASFFVTFIGTLTYCQPIRAIWTPTLIISGEAKCAPVSALVIIGHVATTSTIVTDLMLVIVPAVLLWNTQMNKQVKLQAFGLLSFASVASIVTMVRIPYINKFGGGTNLQFWVAHTMLCSNIETGIGCIASSIPSLRHFFRRRSGESYGHNSGPNVNKRSDNSTDTESKPRRLRDSFKNPTDLGFNSSTVQGKAEDSQSLVKAVDGWDTEESIRQERTFQVDIEMNPVPSTHLGGSNGNIEDERFGPVR